MIIIVGASKGIGKFLFEKYSSINEKVIGTYNTTPIKLNNYYKVDITNFQLISDWIQIIKLDLNKITLINCAGISYNSFAHKSDPEKWKEVIDVNLIGTYNMIRHLLPFMREQNFGRIINISSVVSQKGTPGTSAYAASKSALWGLVKSLCVENGALNITINNINLGYVQVGMAKENVPPSYQEIIKKQIPSGEFCNPLDIYQTIEYLRATSYINGSSIDLNGGLF